MWSQFDPGGTQLLNGWPNGRPVVDPAEGPIFLICCSLWLIHQWAQFSSFVVASVESLPVDVPFVQGDHAVLEAKLLELLQGRGRLSSGTHYAGGTTLPPPVPRNQ